MSSLRYELDETLDQISAQLKSSTMLTGLYDSTDNICKIINAIVKTKGENWADECDLSTKEKDRFTQVFHPFIPHILSFFGIMRGGDDANKADANKTDANKADKGPDEFVESIMNVFQDIDSKVYDVASKQGIIKMELDADKDEDYYLFPAAITGAIMPVNPVLAQTLSEIKVPFRLLVMIVYLFMDVARMSAAASGQDNTRKMLSVAVALLEVMRGDWKKAIMSSMGYFGDSFLFIGQLGKVYLTLFQTLSPTIQDNFIFGAYDAVKSFIIGALLAIFKVTAPYEVRKPIIAAFETIAKNKENIDATLDSVDMKPLPKHMTPSFHDFNNVQALIDDPAFICSKEHQELVKATNTSSIINIIIQMLRIPVTERFIEHKCGPDTKSFVERVAERQAKPKSNASNANPAEPLAPVEPVIAPAEPLAPVAPAEPVAPTEPVAPLPPTIAETQVKPEAPQMYAPGPTTLGGKRGLRAFR